MKLFNNNDYRNALREFGKALQFDERYFDALYMAGMSYYSLEEYDGARAYFRKASEERQEDINLKLKIAGCYIHTIHIRGKGRQTPLRVYFEDVITPLAEKNRDARILLLRYHLEQNKLNKAEEIIERFLRDGEESSDFYEVLVQFNLKKNQISEAEANALKHFIHTPNWMKNMKLIIERLESSEDYEALEKIYNKMIEQVPNKLPYQQDLANIYRSQGNTEMEDRLFRKMLQSYPDNLQVKSDYMNFLVRCNRRGEAESFINEEITKQPENILLKKMQIDLLVKSGQMKKAYQRTEEMLQATPRDTKNYIEFQNMLADLCFRNGAYEKAKKIAEEILSKYRSDRDARFLLCKIYVQEKKAIPAIGELRLLVSENPTVAEYSYYLGLAHELRGETDLAKKAFGTALDNSPGYKDALKKWIALTPKGDSLGEADKKIKNYLDRHPDDNEIKILQQSNQAQTSGILTSPKMPEKQNSL